MQWHQSQVDLCWPERHFKVINYALEGEKTIEEIRPGSCKGKSMSGSELTWGDAETIRRVYNCSDHVSNVNFSHRTWSDCDITVSRLNSTPSSKEVGFWRRNHDFFVGVGLCCTSFPLPTPRQLIQPFVQHPFNFSVFLLSVQQEELCLYL
jgi:hypothetical protein